MSILEDKELRDNVRLKVKNDYGINLTEDDITLCIVEMEKKQVSIFHNQIYPNRRPREVNDKWEYFISWDLTIDGARAIAHRHGLCGIDKPVFETLGDLPSQAQVTVYRRGPRGERYPFTGVVLYEEFVGKKKNGKPNFMWNTKPFNQLAKCAEAQALRKGFQEIGQDDPFLVELDESPIEADPVLPEGYGLQPSVEEEIIEEAITAKFKVGDKLNDQKIIAHEIKDSIEYLKLENGMTVRVFPDGKTDLQFPAEDGGPGRNFGPPQTVPQTQPLRVGPRQQNEPDFKPAAPDEKTVDSQRAAALPLLKKWCQEINDGEKVSYRQAFEKLVGVTVSGNGDMSVNDYDVLIGQLQDSLGGNDIDTSKGIGT